MLILAIESSCDDTSVALLDCSSKGFFVIKEKTASQINIHKKYGGVVPEIAGRMHAEKITPLIETVLKGKKPNVIAVSSGPGLITGLLVGVESAKTLSYAWDKPLVSVNHLEGHIHSVETDGGKIKSKNKIKYPALALVASGGHTELLWIKKQGNYKTLGSTLDDAVGECFDKVAKILGLPYPGGPEISKLGEHGNTKAINFPRPMINQKNYKFSFSGLKTSALYYLRDHPKINKKDFSASFEQAIVDVLINKTTKALKKYSPKTVILAGGVSANKKLRKELGKKIKEISPETKYLIPKTKYAMDNASMIGIAGYYKAKNKKFTSWKKIQSNPNWKLGK